MNRVPVTVLASLGVAFASCDEADVGRCGSGGRLVAQYCVYDGGASSRPSFRCPDMTPFRVDLTTGVVCAPEPITVDDLPDDVCATLDGGCAPAPIPDGGPADASTFDAARPPRPEGGPPGEWTSAVTEPRPTPRSFPSVGVDMPRRRVILFGGWDGDSYGDTWARDLDSGAWTRIDGTGPSPRSEASAVVDVARSRFIVAGGHPDGLQVAPDAWALDLTTHTWRELPAPPRGFGSASTATDGERIWFLVGATADGNEANLLELDALRDEWTERTPAPGSPRPEPRESGLLHFADGALYTIGGHRGPDTFPMAWRFDLATDVWESVAVEGTLPAGSAAHFGVAIDVACGASFIVGGDDGRTAPGEGVSAFVTTPVPAVVALPLLPIGRYGGAAWFDDVRRVLAVTAGHGDIGRLDDVWELPLPSCP